jgi:hypothetical protein
VILWVPICKLASQAEGFFDGNARVVGRESGRRSHGGARRVANMSRAVVECEVSENSLCPSVPTGGMLPISILMPFTAVRSHRGMSGQVTEAVSASSRWSWFFPRESVSLHQAPGDPLATVAPAQHDIPHGKFFDSPSNGPRPAPVSEGPESIPSRFNDLTKERRRSGRSCTPTLRNRLSASSDGAQGSPCLARHFRSD